MELTIEVAFCKTPKPLVSQQHFEWRNRVVERFYHWHKDGAACEYLWFISVDLKILRFGLTNKRINVKILFRYKTKNETNLLNLIWIFSLFHLDITLISFYYFDCNAVSMYQLRDFFCVWAMDEEKNGINIGRKRKEDEWNESQSRGRNNPNI